MLTLDQQIAACELAVSYWTEAYHSSYTNPKALSKNPCLVEMERWEKRHDALVEEQLTSLKPQDNLSTTQTK